MSGKFVFNKLQIRRKFRKSCIFLPRVLHYLPNSAVEEHDETSVEAWLLEEYGISAVADVDLAADGSYSAKYVTVTVSDFGIYEGEAHIDISLQIEAALSERFGCEAEVLS